MLTGSLSWDLESPFYSITLRLRRRVGTTLLGGCQCALAIRPHRQQSDGTMNKLNIVLIFLVYKRRFSQHWTAVVCGTLHPSLARSHPYFIRPKTPLNIVTKKSGTLSKSGSQSFRGTKLTSPSLYVQSRFDGDVGMRQLSRGESRRRQIGYVTYSIFRFRSSLGFNSVKGPGTHHLVYATTNELN